MDVCRFGISQVASPKVSFGEHHIIVKPVRERIAKALKGKDEVHFGPKSDGSTWGHVKVIQPENRRLVDVWAYPASGYKYVKANLDLETGKVDNARTLNKEGSWEVAMDKKKALPIIESLAARLKRARKPTSPASN